jgi:hypothetical protein
MLIVLLEAGFKANGRTGLVVGGVVDLQSLHLKGIENTPVPASTRLALCAQVWYVIQARMD